MKEIDKISDKNNTPPLIVNLDCKALSLSKIKKLTVKDPFLWPELLLFVPILKTLSSFEFCITHFSNKNG
jgi:hypothetical protein